MDDVSSEICFVFIKQNIKKNLLQKHYAFIKAINFKNLTIVAKFIYQVSFYFFCF